MNKKEKIYFNFQTIEKTETVRKKFVINFDFSHKYFKPKIVLREAICIFLYKLFKMNEISFCLEDYDNNSFSKILLRNEYSCRDIYQAIEEINGEEIKFLENPNIEFDLIFLKDEINVEMITSSYKLSIISCESIKKYLLKIIENIYDNHDISISEICLSTNEEIQKYVYEINNTDKKISDCVYLDILFDNMAEMHPDKIAVYDNFSKLSYMELKIKSDHLSKYLMCCGVKKGDFIPIILPRSIDLIVCAIAILKCGAVYVPVAFDWPEKRIVDIIKQTECSYLIVDGSKDFSFMSNVENINTIDYYCAMDTVISNSVNFSINREPEDLAYVIFTSGTTGVPKGVMVSCKSVANVIFWMNDMFSISKEDKLLWVTSFCFDLSVYDIFGILVSGGTIRLASKNEMENMKEIFNIINNEKITLWDSTPNVFNQVINYAENCKDQAGKGLCLRKAFLSGDWIPVSLPEKAKRIFPSVDVVSLGGATEATIWSNYYLIERVDKNWKSIPYGKPIQNARYYILDENMNPLPPYFDGDLYIGGICLSNGYMNLKDATMEKFINNPFKKNEYIYKTGDLARWHEDGNIELIGRSDNQIKLRGFRVELEEVKSSLNNIPYIKDNVIGVEDNKTSISAYIIIDKDMFLKENDNNVNEWKKVFDSTYKNGQNAYVGWNDSLTGNPISISDMEDWVNDTIDVIKRSNPKRVLELGCGTGLIYRGLLSEIELYNGCDISEISVKELKKELNESQICCCAADEFDNYFSGEYDTIILNSVIQYFSSINYLNTVISKSLDHLSRDGIIYIGDVKNYDLLDEFNSIAKVINNSELYISPNYFRNLPNIFSDISHVEILRKNGISNNELTNFRYDVIIYTSKNIKVVNCDNIPLLDLDRLDNVDRYLDMYDIFAVKCEDNKISKFLIENKKDLDIRIPIMNNLKKEREFIVVSRKNGEQFLLKDLQDFKDGYNCDISNGCSIDFHHVSCLVKEKLSELLPYYMIPSKIVVVDSFPLTENGKIDYNKLREIENQHSVREYTPPETETEIKLVEIFENVFMINNLGINASFSALGGHSLRAATISLEIFKIFNIELSIKDIKDKDNVKDIANLIDCKENKNYVQAINNNLNIKPVSKNQLRMYWLQQHNIQSNMYNIVDINEFDSKISVDKLKLTLANIMSNLPILRTKFCEKDGTVNQEINDMYDIPISIYYYDECDINKEIMKFNSSFDLNNDIAWRVGYWETKDKSYLVFIFHHIIMDGVSLSIFKKYFSGVYNNEFIYSDSLNYLDYAVWEEENSNNLEVKQDCIYWKDKLKNLEEITTLKLYSIEQGEENTKNAGKNVFYLLPESIIEKIRNFSMKNKISMYSFFMATINLLLYKYTGNKDIVIGTISSNRTHPSFINTIGMFVNTFPFRSFIDTEQSLKDFLLYIYTIIEEDLNHEKCTYLDIMSEVQTDNNILNMFSCMVAYQNMEVTNLKLDCFQSRNKNYNSNSSKFDISFIININKDKPDLEIEYNTNLYDDNYIDNLAKSFISIIRTILENSEMTIKQLYPFDYDKVMKKYQKINNNFNDIDYCGNIVKLLYESCEKHSSKIALVYKSKKINYFELFNRASILVNLINKKIISKQKVIVIYMKPSIESVIAQLAILLSGNIFITLDPKHPISRNKYIIQDSMAELCIYNSNDNLSCLDINLPFIDISRLDNIECDLLDKKIDIDNKLAYIIYTSGSTGVPKGVKISCRSLLNLCIWHNNNFKITSADNTTRYAGPSFDASIWELFPYILAGSTIHILEENVRMSIKNLYNYFLENKISIAFLPTPVCEEFIENQLTDLPHLRILLTGGDKLRRYVNTAYDLYNNYGPTECTVVTTSCKVLEQSKIPIGLPIDNTSIYIINPENQLCDTDVPGELVVSGTCLSEGYVNSENDVGRFVYIPEISSERFYKTGDIVFLDKNGDINFVGRKDHQIKIRGYRIELEEIESQIMRLDFIEKCVVTTIEKNNTLQVVCFLKTYLKINSEYIREKLFNILPSYMVPSTYVYVDEFPMTLNGKIDKFKLVELYNENYKLDEISTTINKTPETYEESVLLEIWNSVFGNISSIETNFYNIGGDSIHAMQIISKLNSYGYETTISNIYQFPTIVELAKNITKKDYCFENCHEVINLKEIPLLPIQMWYLNLCSTGEEIFNLSETITIPADMFDKEIFEKTIYQVVEKHPILCAKFFKENKWKQKIGEDCKNYVEIQFFDYSDNDYILSNNIVDVQNKNNVNSDINISIGVFASRKYYYIYLCVKHLIIDSYSFKIIVDEFLCLYQKYMKKIDIGYIKKDNAFYFWQKKLMNFANGDINKYINFWNSLPNDKLSPKNNNGINKFNLIYKKDKISDLGRVKHLNSYFDTQIVLLCALSSSILKVFGKKSMLINIENHGRDTNLFDYDLTNAVGWFTVKYPFILKYYDDIEEHLSSIKESYNEFKKIGITYDIIKHYKYKINNINEEDMISFNYLGKKSKSNEEDRINIISSKSNNNKLYALDINCSISDNCFETSFLFNDRFVSLMEAESLLEEFYSSLKIIMSNIDKFIDINEEKTISIDSKNLPIKPFTGIFYKDCYMHSLIPIIEYLGGNIDMLFSKDVCYYVDNHDFIFPLDIDFAYNISENNSNEIIGLKYFPKRESKSIIDDLINAICNDNPVVISVDCFYLSTRYDMYLKTHFPHAILIIGFDKNNRIFTAIDHENVDSVDFDYVNISFDEILSAYKGVISFLNGENVFTYYQFYDIMKEDIVDAKKEYLTTFQNKKNEIIDGIYFLNNYNKKYISNLFKIDNLADICSRLEVMINKIINYKKIELYTLSRFFNDNHINSLSNKIILEWLKVRKFFMKIKLTNIISKEDEKKLNNILESIVSCELDLVRCIEDKKDE